ncbi:hypothetical protein BD410DRAFT_781443 [Rickenella mellea]|uniref:Uncharacterized protein n=1 Tax=Rickenella mellea TaxID=50990 RepID=A0A4Y7QMK8_9AGAM|nr:hypothetical protein BD410DRAFT_781443 [Rickenella mellea]
MWLMTMNCNLPHRCEVLFELLDTVLWLFARSPSDDGHDVFHGRSRNLGELLYESTAMAERLSNLGSRSGVTLKHTDDMGCTATRHRIFTRSVSNKEELLSDNRPSLPNIFIARSMNSNSALIAGATVGACFVLLSLVVLFVFLRHRRLRAREVFISPYNVHNQPGSREIITPSPPASPKTVRFFGSNTSSSKSKRYNWPRPLPPRPDKSPPSQHLATSRGSSSSSIPTERLLQDIVPDMDPAFSPAAIIPLRRPSSPTGSLVVVIDGREPNRKKPILPR